MPRDRQVLEARGRQTEAAPPIRVDEPRGHTDDISLGGSHWQAARNLTGGHTSAAEGGVGLTSRLTSRLNSSDIEVGAADGSTPEAGIRDHAGRS